MIWTITKKEFLLNVMALRFAIGTILCAIPMVIFICVLVQDY